MRRVFFWLLRFYQFSHLTGSRGNGAECVHKKMEVHTYICAPQFFFQEKPTKWNLMRNEWSIKNTLFSYSFNDSFTFRLAFFSSVIICGWWMRRFKKMKKIYEYLHSTLFWLFFIPDKKIIISHMEGKKI